MARDFGSPSSGFSGLLFWVSKFDFSFYFRHIKSFSIVIF